MPDAKKLARIHRVRTLQLNLVRADEVRAQDRLTSEAALSCRIAQLAAAVAPAPAAAAGFSLTAAAHYRERLQRSAVDADARVRNAEAQAEHAAAATRAARQDQSAVEKLMSRAALAETLKALRALEAAPPTRKIRHDPC